MLSRGLHFARPDRFDDGWEGALGVGNIHRVREEFIGRPIEAQAAWDALLADKRRRLGAVGVSCWHESPDESAALWGLYMPRGLGVAVKSSTTRLSEALAMTGRVAECLTVSYSDYMELELPLEPRALLSVKRKEFEHERELRFLIHLTGDEQAAIAWHADVERDLSKRSVGVRLAGIGGGLVYPLPDPPGADPAVTERATADGVYVPVAFSSYVEGVHLAPHAGRALKLAVRDTLKALGLDPALVTESHFGQVPPDQVTFR